jgi:signal transduction histidine kinase
LAAGIAHEINTPTQFVSDNTHFLGSAFPKLRDLLGRYRELLAACRAGQVSTELLDDLEATTRGAKLDYLLEQIPEALSDSLEGLGRVTRIVRAMKDFAHPGQQGLAAADLNKAIESTVTVARNEWKYVADVQFALEPDLPTVPCVLAELNQVILNIVVNAAHAIGDVVRDSGGKGTITISTRQDGNHVEIRIADTGTGIPAEHQARVFDHFFTTKEVGRGTGQGLSMARRVIVEKHRGTLTFETEAGRGTTFIIRLPIEPEADSVSESAGSLTEGRA